MQAGGLKYSWSLVWNFLSVNGLKCNCHGSQLLAKFITKGLGFKCLCEIGSMILTSRFSPLPCVVCAALKCWLCVDRFPLTVTCILFLLIFCLQPVSLITCTLLIPVSLLTCIVIFSFQKCLVAIPFTWGKKASWLIQTEQKLSFLLCITFVREKCKKFKSLEGFGVHWFNSAAGITCIIFLSLFSLEFLMHWLFCGFF